MPSTNGTPAIPDKRWLDKVVKDLSKESVAKQCMLGGGTGWLAGYAASKVGKAVAASIGCTLLLLQLAHHKGFIHINWGKLERRARTARQDVESKVRAEGPRLVEDVTDFVQENVVLAGAFGGGFLIGLAS